VKALHSFIATWHHLIRELVKFGIIGVANFVIDISVSNVFLPIGSLKAKTIGAVVATTFSYFANRHWTFRHRARSSLRREYTLFFLFNGVGLAIALAFVAVRSYGLGLDDRLSYNVAVVLGTVVGTVFRFWSYRRWVFLHPEDALYATEDDPVDPPKVAPARVAEG
jgi:putative flippase GtrA